MPSEGEGYVYNDLLGRLVDFRLDAVQFVMGLRAAALRRADQGGAGPHL